jgi:restriction system protein
MAVPPYQEMFNPALQALRDLGGSCSISEMSDSVAKILELAEEDVNETHKGNMTKLEYRLAWARTYLKIYGLVENSARGVWALTTQGRETDQVDEDEVRKFVRGLHRQNRTERVEVEPDDDGDSAVRWEDEVVQVIQGIAPEAFERLCQRILRESGFIQVEVTGRGADGGIDGRGVVKLGNLLSFHVVFQCKRYVGSVSASTVRDFRGAMVGRADKGLLITTGRFTRDARTEAQRDGAPPLDLVDGSALAIMLKDLKLGVKTALVEEVTVDKQWFDSF